MKKYLWIFCGLFVLLTFIVALREPISIIILICGLAIAIKIGGNFSDSATMCFIIITCAFFALYLNSVNPFIKPKKDVGVFNPSSLNVIKENESLMGRKVINVPSDANATYYLIDKVKSGSIAEITTERRGGSGVTYSKRSYSCLTNEVMYIGTGDTFEKMKSSMPDKGMSKVIPDSIAYYIGLAACN